MRCSRTMGRSVSGLLACCSDTTIGAGVVFLRRFDRFHVEIVHGVDLLRFVVFVDFEIFAFQTLDQFAVLAGHGRVDLHEIGIRADRILPGLPVVRRRWRRGLLRIHFRRRALRRGRLLWRWCALLGSAPLRRCLLLLRRRGRNQQRSGSRQRQHALQQGNLVERRSAFPFSRNPNPKN